MISAVIFDFNGVLVDDESVHFDLFREVLEQEGVVITYQDYHDRYLGYDDAGCFEHVLEDFGQAYDDARIADMIARKGRRYFEVAEQGLKYFPDAAATIRRLSDRYPVAINSGALHAEIVFTLEKLGLRDRVTAIISAEEALRCKPDPAGYVQALDALRLAHPALGLQPSGCLVIEDSLAGIQSGKGAGMKVVGITQTYPAPDLVGAGADATIDGLAELTPAWIDAKFADAAR